MSVNKLQVLEEIKDFLDGYNEDLKYLVNVETSSKTNQASCIIHEPNCEPVLQKVRYQPFIYMKDLSKTKHELYPNTAEDYIERKKVKYGITITKLKTGNQYRLENGYCYKITSDYSQNALYNFLSDGGINPWAKLRNDEGDYIRDQKGELIYPYRDLFFAPRLTEQFFISTGTRLYKGYEEYNNVHRVTFDIETTGLRYQITRVFAIGVRNNRGFEIILEAEKMNDDDAEIKLIQDFFNTIHYIKPAIIAGYNSEEFDFDYILGRAKLLKMDLTKLPTGFNDTEVPLRRRPNVSVKYGNTADRFTATEMWGYSIIDIIHASRRTEAINSDIKRTNLKYIAKFEEIAKKNRTYIPGENNTIGRYYNENKIFVVGENNEYLEIPSEHQEIGKKLHKLQNNKSKVSPEKHGAIRKKYLDENPEFVSWFRKEALPKKLMGFITGKKLVKQYLLDDLWETEQIDGLYNQSSFLLAKIVPTTYQRICTIGTAGIWNLLMTTWSYENDLAIPFSEPKDDFSGGLARCYKKGYTEKLIKIDYGSLYPMEQLTWDIFPIFDITGAIKKILLYLTTTRNIYKKLANSDELNNDEITLLRQIDHEAHEKYINNELTDADRSVFKIKQLPIKILNNSLFGALGSGVAFNWSDNICAARITCIGRLNLRKAIKWFRRFGCIALLAVTDGVNFQIPEKTKIKVTNEGISEGTIEGTIEEMWQYNGKTGMAALIEKFNEEEMPKPFMSIDNDGEYESCLNLSRINYATLTHVKDKKTGKQKEKIKLTGNTIKSKVMSEYIEEFFDKGLSMILYGNGAEFVEYYNEYVEDIYYYRIPLKKIATKSRVKITIKKYKNRGTDKNGRQKGMQAHMELIIQQRERIAEELFQKHKTSLELTKSEKSYSIDDKMKFIINYMPLEPELDSVIYHVNTGYRVSHGSSKIIKDEETGEERLACSLISRDDILNNPEMRSTTYNREKYLHSFNERISKIMIGFDPEIVKKILAKIVKKKEKGKKATYDLELHRDFLRDQLKLKNFDSDFFNESMHLEEKEVRFWNDYGYDPRKVWDGFEMYDDYKVHYEIYQSALDYLNGLMTKINKPRIKAIDDDYKKDDLILIKNKTKYHVGEFNGIFIKIIKENVNVPKSEIELEFDRIREEKEKKIKDLEITLDKETESEKKIKVMEIKRIKYFHRFKEKFPQILHYYTMEELFEKLPEAQGAFDRFIENIELQQEEVAKNFSGGGLEE